MKGGRENSLYLFKSLFHPIGFRGNPHVGLEEAVEETDIFESKRQSYLLDLQVGNLQLRLGIGEDGIGDNLACRAVAHGFDASSQVRQDDVHRLRILVHMMPLLIVLQH